MAARGRDRRPRADRSPLDRKEDAVAGSGAAAEHARQIGAEQRRRHRTAPTSATSWSQFQPLTSPLSRAARARATRTRGTRATPTASTSPIAFSTLTASAAPRASRAAQTSSQARTKSTASREEPDHQRRNTRSRTSPSYRARRAPARLPNGSSTPGADLDAALAARGRRPSHIRPPTRSSQRRPFLLSSMTARLLLSIR